MTTSAQREAAGLSVRSGDDLRSADDAEMRRVLRDVFTNAVDAVMPRSMLEKVRRLLSFQLNDLLLSF